MTGFPARKLKIIGVTGTDGKTTSTAMIYHILKLNRFKVAMISTLYAKIGDETIDTGLHVTTPEPWQLPRILKQMVDAGIEYVIIESTSQGLAQNRLFGIKFDASLITNIGHDHLDYHRTWENYANAKFKLVEKTKKTGMVVVNRGHKSFKWINNKYNQLRNKMPRMVTFSLSEAEHVKYAINDIYFEFGAQMFRLHMIGEYNLENAVGVIKICNNYLNLEDIANTLSKFRSPKGRMELIQMKPYYVIVDFAHTPSSLERALNAIKNSKPNAQSKIVNVFGCAGQRDVSRRKMGAVSAKLADITLVSLEDPRTEKVKDINDEILKEAESENAKIIKRFESHDEYEKTKLEVVESIAKLKKPTGIVVSFDYDEVQNRIDSIDFGLKLLKENDILFVTGKGHEESLAIGDPIVEYPYSDQETLNNLLQSETN
jgi:UDP-N-acetylmuramoyl-L-alanyl-D-glutamate--2,6-diaminopimelate ligase